MDCTHPDAIGLAAPDEDCVYWYCPDCPASGVL